MTLVSALLPASPPSLVNSPKIEPISPLLLDIQIIALENYFDSISIYLLVFELRKKSYEIGI